VDAGDLVVVQGPGAIGLLAAMVAQAVCARDVVILGTPADAGTRFKKAAELGFKHLVNIAETDPVDYVMQLSGGKGADIVVECSGAPRAIPLIPDLLRKQGRVCVIGLTGGRQVELAWDKFAFKALTVVFNMSTFYTSWDKSIDLVASGRVRAEELITHKVKLADWEGAFAAVENLEAIKAVLTP